MKKDCHGNPLPVYVTGKVVECAAVNGAVPQNSVYSLKVLVQNKDAMPVPGQFFMLHAVRSDVLLGRPISVYHAESAADGSVKLEFLILKKGKGTEELCSLRNDDEIRLLGPCGNRFDYEPYKHECSDKPKSAANTADAAGESDVENQQECGEVKKVLIVGGGIGVAPVAGFAESLPENSYDFYASFKSGSYGLDNIHPEKLVITTDDGSVGICGMLPVALTEEAVKNGNYAAVYACGPTPMLKYVKKVAEACGVPCWLSMESRMACGVGVCLGCTIDTTKGKMRCCKDGPVFDSRILFEENCGASVNSNASVTARAVSEKAAESSVKAAASTAKVCADSSISSSFEPDLSVTIAGVKFQNPVIGSSGTFGFGTEYESVFDVNRLGGISSKGLTLEPRQGNDGIRIWETPSGLMNSIGLQNPGIPHFIKEELPQMLALKPVAIANLSGSSLETYVEGAKLLEKSAVPVIELNISCPNVSAGGAAFGMSCSAAEQVVKAVREQTTKPLIVKLTPQSTELNAVALKCIECGADAISLCNSFQGIAIDIEKKSFVFDKIKAGFGGPAVRPIAVRLVYELVQAIKTLPEEKQVPVIAIGGIATWQDAVEFIMAGADALQVGTATFANPMAMIEIIDGLYAFMKRKGYKTLSEMKIS